jgi:hypothetical protein
MTLVCSMLEKELSIMKKQSRIMAKPEYTTSQPPPSVPCSSSALLLFFKRFIIK